MPMRIGIAVVVVCLLVMGRPASAQNLFSDTMVFDSAEIDYAGVDLLLRFKIAEPGTYLAPVPDRRTAHPSSRERTPQT